MAYNIVKLENGNVALYDNGTGDFLKSISPDYVEIECNVNGVVKLIQDNGNVEYFLPADVANTQVLPAAAVPFAGTCADLAELLATDFFFEVAGGGSVDYPTGYYISFLDNFSDLSTGAFAANIVYGNVVEIKSDVSIDRLGIRVNTTTVGAAVLGIYKYDYTANNFALVAQATGTIDTNVSGVQFLTFASTQNLEPGIYMTTMHSNVLCNIYWVESRSQASIFGSRILDLAPYEILQHALAYSGTLPATIPTTSLTTWAPSILPLIVAKTV